MTKRSPQEIADFFGCYVVQDGDDVGRYFHAFSERPTLTTDEDFRIRNVWCTPGKLDCVNWFISIECVEVPEGHDYHILYEPRMQKPEKPDHASHQSEVHIGERYVLLGEFQPGALMQKVDEYLDKGYRLYGNPWTGPDSINYGYIHYQAMVRGV